MNARGCPVCGNPNIVVLDEHGCTTFEICDCCRCEAGYEYDQNSTADHLLALRHKWLETEPQKPLWLGGRPDKAVARRQKEDQLRTAGLEIPWAPPD